MSRERHAAGPVQSSPIHGLSAAYPSTQAARQAGPSTQVRSQSQLASDKRFDDVSWLDDDEDGY